MNTLMITILLIILPIFCAFITYRIGYIKGYHTGASKIVHIWKGTLQEMEDELDDEIYNKTIR